MGIVYSEKYDKFILTTNRTAYCLAIDPENNLQHIYWGRKLRGKKTIPTAARSARRLGSARTWKIRETSASATFTIRMRPTKP